MASTANKHASEAGERNYTMIQGFEWYTEGQGKHWNWLRDNADRFADLGITAVWIPPPTKGSSQDSTGYDVYDLWDFGEFSKDGKGGDSDDAIRTKYGTRKQLEEAIAALRSKGISIYVDAVLNHKMGADEAETFKVIPVSQDNREKEIGEAKDIEGWTKFTFPGRKGKYSEFQWNFQHFTAVDYDNKSGENGIFKIVGKDAGFADDVDQENGGFDYLMGSDIAHNHPDVAKEIINWGRWLVKNFDIQGIRYDAIKHYSREFLHDFVSAVRDEARQKRKDQGKPELDESDGPILFGVGEYWIDNVQTCVDYLNAFGDEQFSLFDAPLHYNFAEAGNAAKDYDLRKIFDGSIVQQRPIDAVTLVENHDSQAGQSLASVVSATFKPLAYAIVLLRESGYPCIFLGDLDGTKGDDHQEATEATSSLDRFCKARKYFAFGEQRDYWDHPQCVGWVRMGTEEHDGCAVVLCIGEGEGEKRMEMGKDKAGYVYVDALGWMPDVEITVGEDGWANFKSPAHSAAVWVPKDAKDLKKF